MKSIVNCIRKKAYDNWRLAEEGAVKMWNNHKNNMDIYKCKYCNKYHLTKGVK